MFLQFIAYRWINNKEVFDSMKFNCEVDISDKTERIYSEITTGKWFENIVAKLPAKTSSSYIYPIIILFEVDKTPLNRTGSHSAYPIRVTCGNLPLSMQGKIDVRHTLAYLPLLPPKSIKIESHSSLCNTLLYHRCWKTILEEYYGEGKGT